MKTTFTASRKNHCIRDSDKTIPKLIDIGPRALLHSCRQNNELFDYSAFIPLRTSDTQKRVACGAPSALCTCVERGNHVGGVCTYQRQACSQSLQTREPTSFGSVHGINIKSLPRDQQVRGFVWNHLLHRLLLCFPRSRSVVEPEEMVRPFVVLCEYNDRMLMVFLCVHGAGTTNGEERYSSTLQKRFVSRVAFSDHPFFPLPP